MLSGLTVASNCGWLTYAWRKVVDPKTASEFAYIMSDIKNADLVNSGKKPVSELGIKALR